MRGSTPLIFVLALGGCLGSESSSDSAAFGFAGRAGGEPREPERFEPAMQPPADSTAPTTPTTPTTTAPAVPPPPVMQRPTDAREPVVAQTPPPPISGGTLIVSADGTTAVASDPDRDRVVFVDIHADAVLGEVALQPGDEPGRLVQDNLGRVHVALRGAGELVSIDLATREVLERRGVCGAPRGVAYDAPADMLHVACLDGALVSLPASGGEPLRRAELGPDLRDVVVAPSGLQVSRFRAAQLVAVDAEGAALEQRSLHAVTQLRRDQEGFAAEPRAFAPTLARRSIALRDGSVAVLHQRSMLDTVELGDPHAPTAPPPTHSGPVASGSAYGGGAGGCSGIVQSAVSIVGPDGGVTHTRSLAGTVLPVDVAASADGRLLAVADAGGSDAGNPLTEALGLSGGRVSLIDLRQAALSESTEMGVQCEGGATPVDGQPIAVAFTPDGALLVQTREPALLHVLAAGLAREIELGGASVQDTGHDIFHRDAGAGIACASCHGEGGDDGHVWTFSGFGARRTQSVNVGLEGTTPFHWSGDMADLPTLVDEVFVARMGGAPQVEARVDALASWMFAQSPPPRMRTADDAAALRGKALFESEDVGCTSCHSGDKLTNNQTVDVGTGEPLQVPSLVGVAYRTPLIHDGCAQTLHDRFDPECGGGDAHGNTSQLDESEIDDLVAYLETL